MKKVLVYTFRTYPFLSDLQAIFPDIVVLDQLKIDLKKLCDKISTEEPILVIGVADSKTSSTFEKFAVNRFHRTKKVTGSDIERVELTTPKDHPFIVRSQSTDSFCNYSMFIIGLFLKENRLNVPFMFTHINQSDLQLLKSLFLTFV